MELKWTNLDKIATAVNQVCRETYPYILDDITVVKQCIRKEKIKPQRIESIIIINYAAKEIFDILYTSESCSLEKISNSRQLLMKGLRPFVLRELNPEISALLSKK